MKYKIQLLLFISTLNTLLSQNLITNGTIEGTSSYTPTTWAGGPNPATGGGTGSAVSDNIEPWEDDFYLDHSPDWYDPCSGGVLIKEGTSDPNAPYFIGADGCGFIGMFEFELIEQEVDGVGEVPFNLTLSLRLVSNPYRINTADEVGPGANSNFDYAPGGAVLNILAARKKIKYGPGANGKDMSDGQEIEVLASINLAADAFPLIGWQQVTKPVSCSFDYDFIGFEVEGAAYVLLDGISLIRVPNGCEGCEQVSCGPYDGCIDVEVGEIHGIDDPSTGGMVHWWVRGLDEVRRIRVQLWNAPGQYFRTIEVNFPGNIWAFDGKDNLGFELPAGSYGYRITMWNDCGTAVRTGQFVKANDSSIDTPPPNYDTPNYVPPEPCCEDYIYINNSTYQNSTLFIDDDMIVAARLGIFIGPGVEIENNTVSCVVGAGGIIKVEPGVTIATFGDIVRLAVVTCDDLTNSDTNERGSAPQNSCKLAENNDLMIVPNPSDGNLTIRLPNENSAEVIVIVRTMGGQILRELKIKPETPSFNLSNLSQGTYIVQVRFGERSYQQKLVVF